jgi:predicted 3-demethylubiquinone-9 3-methyltransferase (glyoxalase superfamily)
MKALLCAFTLSFLLANFCVAQDPASENRQSSNVGTTMAQGFDWLKQFEGTWDVESRTPNVGDDEKASSSVTMTSEAIGEHWMISKQSGKVEGVGDFKAVQTVGYNAGQDRYFGTWVDTTSNYTWKLSGTLDKGGKKLSLESEGPDWQDSKKTRKYRDVYEFKSANEIATVSQMLTDDGTWQTFMKSKMIRKVNDMTSNAKPNVAPFLMFTGQAEEAIDFYRTVFPDLKVESIKKYKAGEAGKEGTIQLGIFEIAGQKVKCTDSPPVHDFTFTPSFSFFVECESLESLKERFGKLSEGGKVMMPINNYGFSDQFGWCSDKFGVSWQLNLSSD